jgi:type I restriction enzyme S subunit
MINHKKEVELGSVSFITKLAGFEHTEYIQPNATKVKINCDDVPMFIGMNIKNGRLTDKISWFLPKKISMQLHRSALTKKCLVLPYVGSVGDVAVFNSTDRHHLASNVAKIELVDDAPFSTEYLYYFLKSPYGQKKLLYYIQGGIQKNITMDAIRKTMPYEKPLSQYKKMEIV